MLVWVTGRHERHNIVAEADGPVVVDAVFLRGSDYARTDIDFGHNEWTKTFRKEMSMFCQDKPIQVEIVDEERLLTSGAVLVEKESGRITLLNLGEEAGASIINEIQNTNLPTVYSWPQRIRDLFVGCFNATYRIVALHVNDVRRKEG